MRGTSLIAFCVAASVAVVSCGSAGGGAIALMATADRPDARVTASADAQQALVEIFSPSGIGGAAVEITSAALPRTIALRLHLRGLEELRFAYAGTTVMVSISSTGDNAVRQTYLGAGREQAITESSPYWMNIRLAPGSGSPATIPLQDGYIEVEAPKDFFASRQTKFAIQWIDFYR
jgi:hypothetical protein